MKQVTDNKLVSQIYKEHQNERINHRNKGYLWGKERIGEGDRI